MSIAFCAARSRAISRVSFKFGMVVNLKTAKDHPDARIGESREVGGGAVTGGIFHT